MNRFLKPANYLHTAAWALNRYVLALLDMTLAPSHEKPLRFPPIFIIGAPRSGSTLLIQVLTDALDVGYLCNLHCRFFGSPSLAEHLFAPLNIKMHSDFSSVDGSTAHRYAPSECGEWWYRFFRLEPAYVSVGDVDEKRMRMMRRSIAALTNALDKPVIFKNLYATLRLGPIIKYYPEALFVVIRRNELQHAQSLLEGRKRVHGNYEAWWSAKPPDYDEIRKKAPHVQVVEQIRSIHRLIRQEMEQYQLDRARIHDITYEDLCRDAHGTVERFSRFLSQHGLELHKKFEIPTTFVERNERLVDADLYESLRNYILVDR